MTVGLIKRVNVAIRHHTHAGWRYAYPAYDDPEPSSSIRVYHQ